MRVCTPQEMRQLDQTAIRDHRIPEQLLMEAAGLAAFRVVQERFGTFGLRAAILAGTGNNGGDGLVVARHLHANGATPYVVLLGDPGRYQGAAKINFELVQNLPLPMETVNSREHLEDILEGADVVVDALLGTGLDREVTGFYAEAIKCVNEMGVPVIALDIPSGVSGLSGQVLGEAVRAEATVSFGLPKRGNLLYPGSGLGGDLYVSHIGFPRVLTDNQDLSVEVALPPPLPQRRSDGHKGSFGDVFFIAGAMGYFGAPVLSALSHLKAGGGYARLASPRSLVPHLAGNGSEIVFHPQPETAAGSLSLAALDGILSIAQTCDFVVMGPGLSLDEETQTLVQELARRIDKPLLVDGDGITALCGRDWLPSDRNAPTILTPHLGEMARLSGRSKEQIQADPIGLLQAEAARLGACIVLKGPHTLTGFPDGRVDINLSGNSGMATAGAGDVLTGTIAAMHGLGLPLGDAVVTGVFLHGMAGDLAAEDIGPDGMTAWDVLEYLPEAVASYREKDEEILENYYGKIVTL